MSVSTYTSSKGDGDLHHQQNDYARLRNQCLNAMNELEILRARHAEIMNQCEKAAQEAEYFRKQHKVMISSLEMSSKEFQSLSLKYEQINAERNKLKQDYEEIVLLREQEKQENSKYKKDSLNAKTFDDLSKENDSLKFSFDDTQELFLFQKCKHLEEDNSKLKQQYDVLKADYDLIVIERNALKQQCAAAICGYEKALRDRDDAMHDVLLHKQQWVAAARELEQAVRLKLQMSKDIIKLREERNSALHEYKLVMSERDTVHQEIEKLQHDLGITKEEAKKLIDDKEKVFLEKEGLQHEIIAVLADRDQAFKEVHDLRVRLQIALKEKEQSVKQLEEQQQDYEMLKQERNAAQKERGEAIIHRDRILKECFEVKNILTLIEQGKGDTENLKKPFDELSNELTKAWNIAEVSMSRRDWAFSVRDKVVRELEDYKEKYKQCMHKNELLQDELKEFKSEYELKKKWFASIIQQLQLRSPVGFDLSSVHLQSSQDSAIDTDSLSYHIETIVLEKNMEDETFGFNIGGGSDAPLTPHDSSVFVVAVHQGTVAAKKLKANDCILSVNNKDMTNVEYQTAYDAINGSNKLTITILRHTRLGIRTPLHRVELKSKDENIGLSIDSGLHINRIEPGSAAAKEETLSIGDKILFVNGYSMENVPYDEAMSLLKASSLSLTVLKPSISISSSQRIFSDDDKSSSTRPLVSRHALNQTTSLDEEIDKILSNMCNEGSCGKRDGKQKVITSLDNLSSYRKSSYFMNPLTKHLGIDPANCQVCTSYTNEKAYLSCKPKSVQGSKVNNVLCSSRHSYDYSCLSPPSPLILPSSPLIPSLNINRADPLAFSPRSSQHSESNLSTKYFRPTSMILSGNKFLDTKHKTRQPIRETYLSSYQANNRSRRAVSEVYDSQSNLLKKHFSNNQNKSEQFGTFPGNMRLDLLQNSCFKNKNTHSFGYKSGNSSDLSDKAVSSNFGNIASVHEETDECLQAFSQINKMESKNSSIQQTNKSCSVESGDEEPRLIVIEKGQYPLGITIAQGKDNGIFVTGLNKESIASKVGLKYGDQLLEYNGINLRMASYEQAEWILKQSAIENTVTVRVQYNPHRIQDLLSHIESNSPIMSPILHRGYSSSSAASNFPSKSQQQDSSYYSHKAASACLPSDQSKIQDDELKYAPIVEDNEEARLIHIVRQPNTAHLGIEIIGGNTVGIFVSDIKKESLAFLQSGLRCGDQILEYNGKSMLTITLEEATLELFKPSDVADFYVKSNSGGFLRAQVEQGDHFYIQALFDHSSTTKGDLSFKKGDILLVKSTLYKGQFGVWYAKIEQGENNKEVEGTIPSTENAEQELLLHRTSSYNDDKLKGRKSLFRRSKKSTHGHSANHSRESSDSRPESEYTPVSLTLSNSFSSGTYKFVKKHDSSFPRPVVVVGALTEAICDKLVMESAALFSRCLPEICTSSKHTIDRCVADGKYIDYKMTRKIDRYECITPQSIKDVVFVKSKHCLLDINPSSIEKLAPLKLYPIIIFIKYKSAKQIKELKDGHYIKDKIPTKTAREMFDNFSIVEKDYNKLFTAIINCTSGLSNLCNDIRHCIEQNQQKVLWNDINPA
ncbi:disks large homolog 5 isoform X2 [Hydra vulgaris]|uniref:Disks large homolog 5 isoform X2 n=1 Tax=Hydra vulgaris TaxID=6087 RepID=A0ABM4BSP1_HYDVU